MAKAKFWSGKRTTPVCKKCNLPMWAVSYKLGESYVKIGLVCHRCAVYYHVHDRIKIATKEEIENALSIYNE